VVIGHVGQATGADGEFRDGERSVFWNGKLVMSTTKVGHIPQKAINKAIKNYKENGNR
jgi:hypothetical protein